jgi:hypothetical protein
MPEFIPGLQLSQAFYWEAVRPIIEAHFPNLPHSAALLGYGSDVIGLDTPVSRDHGWGPRLILFLAPNDFTTIQPLVHEGLRQNLPVRFRGYSTNFGVPDPADSGVRPVREIESGPVEHMVTIHTISSFWQQELGVDPYLPLAPVDWLTFAEHSLLSVTSGQVYYDRLGLENVRQRFAYYPHEVWLYLMAAQWSLIGQEEAFVGRTSSVGDELGSRVIAGRQVERLMRLGFLMEKRYPPYSKWFGSAFRQLDCWAGLGPLLENAIAADSYADREAWLARAYMLAVEMHNRLGITSPLETRTRTYSAWHLLRDGVTEVTLDDPRNTRPHQVIFAGRIAEAINATIHDPQALALIPNAGSVSQMIVPSSDAVESVPFCRSLANNLRKRE